MPDGNYYGDKAVEDDCDYDSDGNGSADSNWATDWQDAHTVNEDWYSCGCAHSQALNCNRKAYAAWWLWARLAGWPGPEAAESQKTAFPERARYAETVTYTVVVEGPALPLMETVHLTDTLPAGLAYIPGTLVATSGIVTDTAAPTLRWSGVLTPAPAVTVTYAVTVSTSEPQLITNTAIVAAPGAPAIAHAATVWANWRQVYLPLILAGPTP